MSDYAHVTHLQVSITDVAKQLGVSPSRVIDLALQGQLIVARDDRYLAANAAQMFTANVAPIA